MPKTKLHIAVVGAGAMGGWIALQLLRRGTRVTLLDGWGPGHSRATSGGETRVLRGTYGPDQPYTQMAARAMKLWAQHERRHRTKLLHPIGVLWMAYADDRFERESLPLLQECGIRFEELSPRELKKRWPQINFQDVDWGIFEPDGGYLRSR